MSLPPPLKLITSGRSEIAVSSCSAMIGPSLRPRIARLAYRMGSCAAAARPRATKSAHPRTVPSGSSSPTPSVKLSPIAAYEWNMVQR